MTKRRTDPKYSLVDVKRIRSIIKEVELTLDRITSDGNFSSDEEEDLRDDLIDLVEIALSKVGISADLSVSR